MNHNEEYPENLNPEEQNKKEHGVSRRNFLKYSTAGIVAASSGGLLAGCSPEENKEETAEPTAAPSTTEDTTGATSQSTGVKGYSGTGDWLGEAPVIADADIAETKEVDVLILGAGHAGVMAAVSAVDAGATVAVIEKNDEAGFFTDYWHRVGEDIGHVNSKWLIDRGFGPYDTGEVVDEFIKRTGGRVNPEIIRKYVENSGAMFDKMVEIYESYEDLRKERFGAVEFEYSGDNARTETIDFSNMMSEEMLFNQSQLDLDGSEYPIEINGYKTWPTVAMFQGPMLHDPVGPFVSALRYFETFMDQYSKDNGAEWYYEHEAVVLTQDADGSVTGAIVKDAEGKYIKFVAAKGTLVATGDFSGNPEMCWALLNDLRELAERAGEDKLNGMYQKGYGHKMCCWAGGLIESLPRATMGSGGSSATGPWGMGPMLQLNANAKRYANEGATPWLGQNAVRQPKGILSVITDSKYLESIKIAGLDHGGPNLGRGQEWLDDLIEDMGNVVDAGADGYPVRSICIAERSQGTVYGAETLEELAGFLGYEGDQIDTFVAEIERYNEMCYAGVDSDFGKDAKALIPIDEAPFYGCAGSNSGTIGMGLVTLTGMVTDGNLNVLDADGNPIKGLYVAGNTLGGRYGVSYVTPYAGNSVGMALTHGWLAGQIITS